MFVYICTKRRKLGLKLKILRMVCVYNGSDSYSHLSADVNYMA